MAHPHLGQLTMEMTLASLCTPNKLSLTDNDFRESSKVKIRQSQQKHLDLSFEQIGVTVQVLGVTCVETLGVVSVVTRLSGSLKIIVAIVFQKND